MAQKDRIFFDALGELDLEMDSVDQQLVIEAYAAVGAAVLRQGTDSDLFRAALENMRKLMELLREKYGSQLPTQTSTSEH
jgi:hypothetical protein